jgi:hypothetical protein
MLLLVVVLAGCGQAQSPVPEIPFPQDQVEEAAERYTVPSITTRRFKQEDLRPLIQDLGEAFAVDTAGYSVEGRPLWRVRYGSGPVQVLLWSQMHGDEPTATAALFDIFRLLGGSGDGLVEFRKLLSDELTLTFLPMLNPDGAARYERRNALGIDLNRDALTLISPEARLLKSERDRLDADWGFNLHDQGIYYAAGFPAERGCVLSILAPAYDWEKSMNEKRTDAAQLIARMNAIWQEEVPGSVGRYNDDFEPRAFGDNLQRWGTRTILIESGGYPGDPEKQQIRRLNVIGILAGLHAIATDGYERYSVDDYLDIPRNASNGMHHLILEDLAVPLGDSLYRMDVGMRLSERTTGPENRGHQRRAYVSDLGDLHTFGAFTRLPAQSLTARVGQTYPETLTLAQIDRLDAEALYRQGYTSVRTSEASPSSGLRNGLAVTGDRQTSGEVSYGRSVDLLLHNEVGELVYAIVNGEAHTLPTKK